MTVADRGSASLSGLADLGFHTYGTTLCISLWVGDFKAPRGFFSGLCNELSAMSIANITLKTLRIEINADALKIPYSGEWGRLDAILSGPRWSSLENISIDILTWETPERFPTDFPKTQLTRLSTRTSSNFRFSVRAPYAGWWCLGQ